MEMNMMRLSEFITVVYDEMVEKDGRTRDATDDLGEMVFELTIKDMILVKVSDGMTFDEACAAVIDDEDGLRWAFDHAYVRTRM